MIVRAGLRILALGFLLLTLSGLVPVPPNTARVVDTSGTFSSSELAVLEARVAQLENEKGAQFFVLLIPTTDGEAIESYALRVAEEWKIGREKVDDGVLLLVAKHDRRIRFEVGYGLEGVLPDAKVKRITDEIITPQFRDGKLFQGVSDGVDAVIGLVSGEELPAPAGPSSSTSADAFTWGVVLIFFLAPLFRSLFGSLRGAVVASGSFFVFFWLLFGFLTGLFMALLAGAVTALVNGTGGGVPPRGRRYGSSSWGGGGYSGRAGGGFSGGGGGRFGGGGASGSW